MIWIVVAQATINNMSAVFGDTRSVSRNRKWKDRQYNGQQKKDNQ